MLAKKTSKNQVTLPKSAVEQFPGIDYFEVTVEQGQIRLTPVRVAPLGSSLAAIRRKIADLGLTEKDVKDAIAWARRSA